MPDEDKELFADAFGARDPEPEPAKVEPPEPDINPEPAPVEPKAEIEEQVSPEPEIEVEEQPEAEPASRDHRVPLSELLTTRERAQKAEAERERFEREAAAAREEAQRQIQAMQQQLQRIEAERHQQPPPDRYQDPDAYEAYREQAASQREQQLRYELAETKAYAQYGYATVKEAMEEALKAAAADPQLDRSLSSAPNPFAAVVEWHRSQKVLAEVGDDPQAYREKLRQTLLQDPEFRKQAMETWQAEARSAQPGSERPQSTTRLPPSLSKTPASKSAPVVEMDDAGLLKEALGSR